MAEEIGFFAIPGLHEENARIEMEKLKEGVEELIEAGSEITSTAFVENLSGVSAFPMIYHNREEKHFLYKMVLPVIILSARATKVAFIETVRFYTAEKDKKELHSEHPERQEGVFILILTASAVESALFVLERDEKGRLRIKDTVEPDFFSDYLHEECMGALREVAEDFQP